MRRGQPSPPPRDWFYCCPSFQIQSRFNISKRNLARDRNVRAHKKKPRCLAVSVLPAQRGVTQEVLVKRGAQTTHARSLSLSLSLSSLSLSHSHLSSLSRAHSLSPPPPIEPSLSTAPSSPTYLHRRSAPSPPAYLHRRSMSLAMDSPCVTNAPAASAASVTISSRNENSSSSMS
jgi:hypothetical protein